MKGSENECIEEMPDAEDHLGDGDMEYFPAYEYINPSEPLGLDRTKGNLVEFSSKNPLDALELHNKRQTPPDPLEFQSDQELPQLEYLDLSNCHLSQSNTDTLFNHKYTTTIKHLNLSGNPCITHFPVSMRYIKELHYLDMSDCGLTQLPKFMPNLSKIRHLNVGKNKSIGVLPKWIGCLKLLQYLNISECGLDDLSGTILPSGLRSLDMSGNKGLTKLPRNMGNLRHLLCLNMSGCGFTECPGIVSTLKRLAFLDMSGNVSLHALPDSMVNLSLLQHLNLSNCGLVECPGIISTLARLKYLRLRHNDKLSMLPQTLVKLKNLEQLDCQSCDLSQVPEFLCKIKSLKNVDLTNNHIQAISECCTKRPFFIPTDENLVSICVVKFDFDRLVRPPKEILLEGPMACIDFYKEDRVSSMAAQSLCSVNLIGSRGAGKSSLVQTIMNGKGILETSLHGTVVIDNFNWTVNETLFHINDFSGHELFDIMCPIWLGKNNQLVLIVVNMDEYTNENHDELVTKWLDVCSGHINSGKVAIIATQSDLCQDGEIEKKCSALRNKLDEWRDNAINDAREEHHKLSFLGSQGLPVFVCSSKSGIGFNEIKLYLCTESEEVRIMMPSAWLRIYKIIVDKQYENCNSEVSTIFVVE